MVTDTDRERAREFETIARALCRTHARYSPAHRRSDEEIEKFIDWHWQAHDEAEAIIQLLAEARRGALEEAMEALVDQAGFAEVKMHQFEQYWPGHPRCDAMSYALTEVAKKLRGDLIRRALAASDQGKLTYFDIQPPGDDPKTE